MGAGKVTKAGMRKLHLGNGITVKITQLAWLVTLLSLSIFIAFNTAEQKLDLQNGLSSKGQSLAVSLGGEVASAAVSEDYTSVVEHAMEVIQGDKSVAFLLIVKNDGYSILVKRDGWQMLPSIDRSWYQDTRTVSAEIETVSLVNERLFHYKYPLDCIGIPWGWIHIGLELDDYDHSVRNIYMRAVAVGLLCMLLSLAASILFARWLVKPIQEFRTTVEKFTAGDMSGRVELNSHDEIQQLGTAFNDMADAILQRDAIVQSVRTAAELLQGSDQWDKVGNEVISEFGKATHSSRTMLVAMLDDGECEGEHEIRIEWADDGITPYGILQPMCLAHYPGVAEACNSLKRGELLVHGKLAAAQSPENAPMPFPLARMAAPIFADGKFWGTLVLHDCTEAREWKEMEKHAIRTIADMFGAAIQRERVRQTLLAAKDELEHRVQERTAELSRQIEAKDQAHQELQQAQRKLIELSRISGMAEVATGVLHNVGNVLNSINVGASLIVDRLNDMKLNRLGEVVEIIKQNESNLESFLRNDPRGQRVMPYLQKLSEQLATERANITEEAKALVKHVGHVKEIVAMQQGYARNCGVLEKVSAEELFENAVSITSPALDRHGVEILRTYEPLDEVMTDRHKVLQILLNLLQNAKDAAKAGGKNPRRIWLRLRRGADNTVIFEVEDNGIGIKPENLVKIFSHGFTTKRSGHGFGLHSGALAARELGGSLNVYSDGPGTGATFVLEIPMQARTQTSAGVPQ